MIDSSAFSDEKNGIARVMVAMKQMEAKFQPLRNELRGMRDRLANAVAVARGARSMVLLGDPQQLPQVSQGTHPEPVDTSALGWLVDGGAGARGGGPVRATRWRSARSVRRRASPELLSAEPRWEADPWITIV